MQGTRKSTIIHKQNQVSNSHYNADQTQKWERIISQYPNARDCSVNSTVAESRTRITHGTMLLQQQNSKNSLEHMHTAQQYLILSYQYALISS